MTTPDVSQSEPKDLAQGSALKHVPSHMRLWLIAAIGLAVDLWTKHWAFTHLPAEPDRGWPIIPHLTSLQRSLNTGALFGLGKGWTPVFIAASFLALGFVFFLFAHSTRERWTLHIGLGLVLAGALGNLYDRVFAIADVVTCTVNGRAYEEKGIVLSQNEQGIRLGSWPEGKYLKFIPSLHKPEVQQKGVVRDFIRMEPRIRLGNRSIDIWPWVFNIADSLLVVGVALLMLNFWRDRRLEQAVPQPGAPPAEKQAGPTSA